MTSLYLSRARLRRDAPPSALRHLLADASDSARAGAGHRLIWTLFGDGPDRTRDFLWREAELGVFYFLSARLPEDREGVFALDQPKPFAPLLAAGDRLRFALRANATVARVAQGRPRANGRVRGKPCDVVMNVLAGLPRADRAAQRHSAVLQAGMAWLVSQGQRAGFTLAKKTPDGAEDARVLGYRTLRVEHAGPAARLGILDLEGVLTVENPEVFGAALSRGFGRAKAFGCGLMLIRRA